MGFKAPSLEEAYRAIRNSVGEIKSPFNDGFTQMNCKEELYKLKCWLDDQYNSLPKFSTENEWEQDRIVEILKHEETNR